MNFFPRESFHIVSSDALYANPDIVYSHILKFLGLEQYEHKRYLKYNVGKKYNEMKITTRKKLVKFFEPYNKELHSFIGNNFNWDR